MSFYNFGDVVLVAFPFTDQTSTKKRPAVVISSAAYHNAYIDLLLMAITSQARAALVGEVTISHWQAAGLLKPSVIKPVITTLEHSLILHKFGSLLPALQAALRAAFPLICG